MTTVLLATSAAAVFGCSDFLGGFASRRDPARTVSLVSQLFGLAALLAGLALLRTPVPGWEQFAIGAVAGIMGGLGVLSLYAALAVGRMGVVAPITAALAGAIPAGIDIAVGTRFDYVSAAGIGLAIAAVAVVSFTPVPKLHLQGHHGEHKVQAVLLSIAAGVMFAGFFTGLSLTDPAADLWPLLGARIGSIPVLAGITAASGGAFMVSRAGLKSTIGAGLLDMVANILALLALQIGPLAIAGVLVSLYPVSTVLLARYVLGEKLHGWQRVGVAMALVAVVLTAL